MAASLVNLTLSNTGLPLPTLSADTRVIWLNFLADAFAQLTQGGMPQGAQVIASDGVALATGTITFTGNGTATDTVTIGGQALTAVASGAGANQWNVGTSTTTAAANLVTAINASAVVSKLVTASSVGAVVTLTANSGGTLGNLVTMAKTSTSISAVSATLSGGATNVPLTLVF